MTLDEMITKKEAVADHYKHLIESNNHGYGFMGNGLENCTEYYEEHRQLVERLKELKWWRSQPPMCMTCKHFKKSAYDEPCIACREWSNWELNIKE